MQQYTVADVLDVISDSKSLEMFTSIAKNGGDSEELKHTKELTKKQFYSRMKELMNAGVVKRDKGRFSLTSLGAIVYHAQLIIESGINNYWKLRALDSIQSSGEIAEHERLKLVKTILNDNMMENILVKQA